MDRVAGYEPVGRGFESSPVRQKVSRFSTNFFVFYNNITPSIPESNIIFIVESLNLICIKSNNINTNNALVFNIGPSQNIFDDKFIIEYIISDSIIGFNFFKIYCIDMFCLNLLKNLNTSIIIIKDGRTTPKVEKIAPGIPPFLKPINVLMFTANGPGVDSDIPINSKISFVVPQEYFKI